MSSNTFIFLLFALVAGAMIPTQAAVNNKMAATLDSTALAALISFFIGTLALFVYTILSGTPIAALALAKDAPAVAWVGGLLGAFFVTASIALIPRLGVPMTFSLIVAGQMLASLVIDHFGLLGQEVKEINLARVAGILLITAGVVLIRRF
ncbi:MAG: DMT family transporter [Pyrinomonadaceae bacterium]